jgi:predicted nucleic acid-binding Zn ribbon protein
MFCLQCGKQLPDDSKFCSGCGVEIVPVVEDPKGFLCSSCGLKLEDDDKFCKNCGTPKEGTAKLEKYEVFCMSCGTKLEEGVRFCSNCGKENSGYARKGRQEPRINQTAESEVFDETQNCVPLNSNTEEDENIICQYSAFFTDGKLFSYTHDYGSLIVTNEHLTILPEGSLLVGQMLSGITQTAINEMHIPWPQIEKIDLTSSITLAGIKGGIHLDFNYKLKNGKPRDRLNTWVLPGTFIIFNDVPSGDKESTKELYQRIFNIWSKYKK